jgi:hypothetical protein
VSVLQGRNAQKAAEVRRAQSQQEPRPWTRLLLVEREKKKKMNKLSVSCTKYGQNLLFRGLHSPWNSYNLTLQPEIYL